MAKKKNGLDLSSPLLYIVLGALLVVFPGTALSWAMTIAGLFFLITGVLDVVKGKLISGIVGIIIGVAILVLGWLLVDIVLLVLGIMIALKGIIALIEELKKKKTNIIGIIVAIVTIVAGAALAFGNGLDLVITIVGIVLIVDGVLGLLGARK